ncbi:MAG: hypothetical protein MRZ79_12150 [Bacteroidia bacterium]|nr:hypothetical protein [Bacteroidia bacterium]
MLPKEIILSKKLTAILLGVLFAFFSACTEKKGSGQGSVENKELTQALQDSSAKDTTKLDSLPKDPEPQFCVFDPVEFKKRRGIGYVKLLYNHFPYTAYQNPDGSGDSVILSRDPNYYRGVLVSGKAQGYFKWYQPPNEYDDGTVIWRDSSIANGSVGIALNENAPTYWLMPDSNKYLKKGFYAWLWTRSSAGSSIHLAPSDPKLNPLRKFPNDTAAVVPKPNGYQLYSIVALKHPWIQVNKLLETNGPFGNDRWSEPIGWMKWYCDGIEQVEFLDPIQVENYYVD